MARAAARRRDLAPPPTLATARALRRRKPVDEARVVAALEAIRGEESPATGNGRQRVLKTLRGVLDEARSDAEKRFRKGLSGLDAARLNARTMDSILAVLCDFALRRVFPLGVSTPSDQISAAATGGYGRGELAPYSDIDLLFLIPYKVNPRAEQVVEYVLYMLWDMGLKVGHATRSIAECVRAAKGDVTVRTTLLDARFIAGDPGLFNDFVATFDSDVVQGSALNFVEAKLAERDARHRTMGDTRYLLEPNIKDGKGGLRDLHTLYWISRYVYGVRTPAELTRAGVLTAREAAAVTKATAFFWTLRFNLHLWSGRPDETLTFDAQKAIAPRMGYKRHRGTQAVERLMKHYFLTAREVGNLTRVLCASLHNELRRTPVLRLPRLRARWQLPDDFRVAGDWLTVVRDDAFARDPVLTIELFREAAVRGLDVHPDALRRLAADLRHIGPETRRDPRASAAFLDVLCGVAPETTLRRMNEAGVLGRFLPDFGRIVCQMQFNMYHHYTVDEHSIRAIGMLERMERGKADDVPAEIAAQFRQIGSRRALYVAMLLHDVAKGRGGDHSVLGAQVVSRVGPRLGLEPEETETASWLVLNHLVLNDTATKRDVEDPNTLRDLVAVVQSPERLRLLLVLTVADIQAVGQGVWNAWKGTLLLGLFHRAMEAISGGMTAARVDRRVEQIQQAVRAELSDWDDAAFEEVAGLGYSSYWLAFDAPTHARHLRLIQRAEREKQPLSVDTRVDRTRGVTEVTVYAADHPGLFASIAGALALSSASVVDARIFTMTNGMALDSFWVQDIDGGPIDQSYRIARISAMIGKALTGRVKLREELAGRKATPRRARAFTVWPRVLIDNEASAGQTVVEVNGRDRPGLLFEITDTLTRLGLQIGSAHVTTFGERAVDVFYLKDVFGMKVTNPAKLSQIQTALRAALEDGPAAAQPDSAAGD